MKNLSAAPCEEGYIYGLDERPGCLDAATGELK